MIDKASGSIDRYSKESMATPRDPIIDEEAPPLGNSHSRSNSRRQRVQAGSVYRKRDEADFTADELEHLEKVTKNSWLRRLKGFRVFGEPMVQLSNWLYFFEAKDDHHTYGAEMQHGLIQLWSTFILMDALLAGVATQPFVATQGLVGWRLTWYGLLWMLSLLTDFFALGTTALFLGYLLANPGKLSWKWLCNIGALRGIPSILMLLTTLMSLVAIGFTTFVLYGWKVGAVCAIVEVIIIAAGTCIASLLSDASDQVIKSELH